MGPIGTSAPTERWYRLGELPYVWVPSTGPTVGGLVARVGMVDETVSYRGISHLVEHSLLRGLDRSGLDVNGSTGPYTTQAFAVGEHALVADTLATVARRVGSQEMVAAAMAERDVLRAEAEVRGPHAGLVLDMVLELVGLAGPARALIGEVGRATLDPDRIHRWATAHINVANVAVWSSGERPLELHLDLPSGAANPAMPPTFRLGHGCHLRRPGLDGVLGLGERSAALVLGLDVAARRLRRVLRDDLAVSYGVEVVSVPCGAGAAFSGVVADVRDGGGSTAHPAVVRILEDLRTSGPTWDELAFGIDSYERASAVPGAAPSIASGLASDLLLGMPASTAAWRHELAGVTPETARAAVARLLDVAVWVAPTDAELDGWWVPPAVVAPDPRPPLPAVEPYGPEPERIVLTGTGIWVGSPDGGRSVDWDRTVALLAWRDGTRRVVRDDGWDVWVVPSVWRDGATVVEAIDAAIPADRRAEVGFRGRVGTMRTFAARRAALRALRSDDLWRGGLLGVVIAITVGLSAGGAYNGTALLAAAACCTVVMVASSWWRRRHTAAGPYAWEWPRTTGRARPGLRAPRPPASTRAAAPCSTGWVAPAR